MLRKLIIDFLGRLGEQLLEPVYEITRSGGYPNPVAIGWQLRFALIPRQQLQAVVGK